MATYFKSISAEYAEYIEAKGSTLVEVPYLRIKLFNRIITEEKDILTNETFLALIEDETAVLLAGGYHKGQLSGLVTITRVLRRKRDLEYSDTDSIRILHNREFTQGSVPDKVIYHSTNWFADILLEEEQREESIKYTLAYITSKVREVSNIEISFRERLPEFALLNSKVDFLTSDIPRLLRDRRTQGRMSNICLSLAVMNYSLGDLINAKFFLMKAVLLNHDDFEANILMKFLNNTLLLD